MKPIRLVEFLIQYSFFLISASVHESSHAWTAFRFGDPTAKFRNRISLNPIHHIDVIGTVIIPLIVFLSNVPVIGWAKPTPINPKNLKNPRKDSMYISGAGPISNLLCVVLLAILWHIANYIKGAGPAIELTTVQRIAQLFCYVFGVGILINLMLAVFNLMPIHPLDGSGVVEGLLPRKLADAYEKLRPFGFFILIALFYTPAFKTLFNQAVVLLGNFLGIEFKPLEGIW